MITIGRLLIGQHTAEILVRSIHHRVVQVDPVVRRLGVPDPDHEGRRAVVRLLTRCQGTRMPAPLHHGHIRIGRGECEIRVPRGVKMILPFHDHFDRLPPIDDRVSVARPVVTERPVDELDRRRGEGQRAQRIDAAESDLVTVPLLLEVVHVLRGHTHLLRDLHRCEGREMRRNQRRNTRGAGGCHRCSRPARALVGHGRCRHGAEDRCPGCGDVHPAAIRRGVVHPVVAVGICHAEHIGIRPWRCEQLASVVACSGNHKRPLRDGVIDAIDLVLDESPTTPAAVDDPRPVLRGVDDAVVSSQHRTPPVVRSAFHRHDPALEGDAGDALRVVSRCRRDARHMRPMRVAGGRGQGVVVVVAATIGLHIPHEVHTHDVVDEAVAVVVAAVDVCNGVLPVMVHILTGVDVDVVLQVFMRPHHARINDGDHNRTVPLRQVPRLLGLDAVHRILLRQQGIVWHIGHVVHKLGLGILNILVRGELPGHGQGVHIHCVGEAVHPLDADVAATGCHGTRTARVHLLDRAHAILHHRGIERRQCQRRLGQPRSDGGPELDDDGVGHTGDVGGEEIEPVPGIASACGSGSNAGRCGEEGKQKSGEKETVHWVEAE